MQLNLNLGAAGEDKKKHVRASPISGKTYEKFINSLPSNDIVKKKLLILGRKVPSMTLGYIIENITLYIGRAEFEIKQEELKIMQENQRYEIESQSKESKGKIEEVGQEVEGEEVFGITLLTGDDSSDEDQS